MSKSHGNIGRHKHDNHDYIQRKNERENSGVRPEPM